MKASMRTVLVIITSITIYSCSKKDVSMDEVVSYFNSKGYSGDVLKDSSDNSKKEYSEMVALSNLQSTVDNMSRYGYFLNNSENRKIEFGSSDFEKVCKLGLFNPYYLLIQKKNSSFSGFGQFQEEEYFRLSTQGQHSYFCNDSVLAVMKELNLKIKNGEFTKPENKTHPEQGTADNLLISEPFNIWDIDKYDGNMNHIPLQLIQTPDGYLWITANTYALYTAGYQSLSRLTEDNIGYKFHYFDKNGFHLWSQDGVNPVPRKDYCGPDTYLIIGYKIEGDSIDLLIKHTYPTSNYAGNKDLCYEVYIQKMNVKSGEVTSHQTLSKHFNETYRESFENIVVKGLSENMEIYLKKDDELTEDEKNLTQSFIEIIGTTKCKVQNDEYELKVKGENKVSYNEFKSTSLLKNGTDILNSKTVIDKYFDAFMFVGYSDIRKEFAGIAMGVNFWNQPFFYIRAINLNGECRPIILKQKI